MTNEDKKIVADYMGWIFSEYGGEYYYIPKNGKVIYFDLNDAGLVVEEMVKRDEWDSFIDSIEERTSEIHATWVNLFAWLFNADNFFEAFVYWRKGK